MDNILQISAVLALLAFVFFVFTVSKAIKEAVGMLNEANQSLNKMVKDFGDVKQQTMTSLASVDEFKNEAKEKLEEISAMRPLAIELLENSNKAILDFDVMVNKLDAKVDRIESVIEPYERLAKNTYEKVAPPINNTANLISASAKAVSTFINRMNNR